MSGRGLERNVAARAARRKAKMDAKQEWIDRLNNEIDAAEKEGKTRIKLPRFMRSSDDQDVQGLVYAHFRKQGYVVRPMSDTCPVYKIYRCYWGIAWGDDPETRYFH